MFCLGQEICFVHICFKFYVNIPRLRRAYSIELSFDVMSCDICTTFPKGYVYVSGLVECVSIVFKRESGT